MGASSSTEQVPAEQREAESLAASTGALPTLKQAFSLLSDPRSNSIPIPTLQKCFCLVIENQPSESSEVLRKFHRLLTYVGTSIADLYFVADKGVSWIEFLRGYVKCCGRMPASESFNILFQVFSLASKKVVFPTKLEFVPDEDNCKMTGFLLPVELLMLLSMCFAMNKETFSGKGDYTLSDLNHLVLSAVLLCAEAGTDFDPWDCDILNMDVQLPIAKVCMWALKTVPSLPECFSQFVNSKIQKSVTSEIKKEASCSSSNDLSETVNCSNTNLLTREMAWAISLTLRNSLKEGVLEICFAGTCDETDEKLLYRSSLHGRGLNRFWSNIDGYNGPVLILVAASSLDVPDDTQTVGKWIIGALTYQPLENKDTFYGNSGSLYAISPIFNVFPSAGKEKNFVYSHLHPAGIVYDPHPKPVGISFGGSIGNERVSIDEDFAKVTLRHHAIDKTYQHGSLFPNQGFLPTEASIMEVEVWGLGGRSAKQTQALHKRREELFTEQRRKVDLKTFSNWEDSPEKMMMDMMSNPNAVRREDR